MLLLLLLLFLASSVKRVTLPRPRERTGCLALPSRLETKGKKPEREFSLTDRKKTASSPLGNSTSRGEGSLSQGRGDRARESGEGWASEHSTVHSKEKGGGQHPG
ncbi:uncharacterized protein CCOS01_10303 [Colletotrichum costaricense]|uniref:Secreted protein n=1 Tax=Colletotrichum costaricense TaxID=1209916 RepID=A0AAJ0DYK0_9PEZI|nr:uncharacterized protein CCOS01_10303 [Colletotrichum costaricense]KAK1522591.1 hypothetical protein CCOS01_10303 [Colletotrichum costaricense]